jgi:hypothetical protein
VFLVSIYFQQSLFNFRSQFSLGLSSTIIRRLLHFQYISEGPCYLSHSL